jgi:hypothetical protein
VPIKGWKFALIDIEFFNSGSAEAEIVTSELKFRDEKKSELESYIFYPEDLTMEEGKEGYFPLASQLLYIQTIKGGEKRIDRFLIVIPEDEKIISVTYENMEPLFISIE